jgi:hypothetical protein
LVVSVISLRRDWQGAMEKYKIMEKKKMEKKK